MTGKGLFLGQRLTQQQLLLLRQTALQQQQLQLQQQKQHPSILHSTTNTQPTTPATPVQHQLSPVLQRPTSAAANKGPSNTPKPANTASPIPATGIHIPPTAKLQLPGIDQLRPSITLSTTGSQRVPSTLVRAGLPARSMQTDEVLALLRQQQALRLAMQSQTVKLSATTGSNTNTSAAAHGNTAQNTAASLNEAIAVAAMAAAINKPPVATNTAKGPLLVNPVVSSASSTDDGKTSDPRTTTHNN